MKIYLKQNWSEQFIYGDKTPGYFEGREQEIKSLKNIIKGNVASAVLIASVRGVGKTSFVHKTLSEIKDVYPIFVNISQALTNSERPNDKKNLILISLIRAAHFNKKFKNDQKLEEIYRKCFGKYTEETSTLEETTSQKSVGVSKDLEVNGKTIIQLLSLLFVSLGISLDNYIWRMIIGFIGLVVFFLSFKWQKNLLNSLVGKKSLIIDNSTEYLEIEFENWLRNMGEKKIVFVIDELDKIEEVESLTAIKEYKNLFNRSFAHFLFLSSQNAFDLVSEDREKDAKEGGTFPTLFTHIIYLSLPKSSELKDYLSQILISTRDVNKDDREELVNYLLFRSGNDFFDLKRNISDFISFDKRGEDPFIDTDKIKDGDPNYFGVSKLFNYVDQWFLLRNIKELKKFWKDNSLLQKKVFQFLNLNYNKNFDESIVTDSVQSLVLFLADVGILNIEEVPSEINSNIKNTTYQWTGKYKRDVQAPLLEEDKKFINSFRKLIKLANDLDDLPTSYQTDIFEEYDRVIKGRDGEKLSGVNLYSFYSDYHEIFEKLQEGSQRISVATEVIKDATKVIDEQIKNVSEKYFDILINILNESLLDKPDFFINENINSTNHNINGVFNALPNFLSVATPEAYQSRVYGKTDQTKYALIIKNFEDEDHIGNALEILRNNTNLIVVNLVRDDRHAISYPKVFRDKIGRNRKKPIEVKNFINFKFNDFRQLAKILRETREHLGIDIND